MPFPLTTLSQHYSIRATENTHTHYRSSFVLFLARFSAKRSHLLAYAVKYDCSICIAITLRTQYIFCERNNSMSMSKYVHKILATIITLVSQQCLHTIISERFGVIIWLNNNPHQTHTKFQRILWCGH